MKIHAYVTGLNITSKKPSFGFLAHKPYQPSEWTYLYSFDHQIQLMDDEITKMFNDNKDELKTPEQEISDLKEKLKIAESSLEELTERIIRKP